jgi:hypothetical protein
MKTDAGKVDKRRNDFLGSRITENFFGGITTRHHRGLRELSESAVLQKFEKESDDFIMGD